MPAHVRAAEAPEDLWRCHECGWTYPNHHPSAKHRRNHKKQCGKIPGFMKAADAKSGPQGAAGSSDDGSSDEEHRLSQQAHEKNGRQQELPQCASPVVASNVEPVCRGGSDPTNTSTAEDGGAPITPKICEEAALSISTRNVDRSALKEVAETPNRRDLGQNYSLGSAHTVKGQWSCKHCGLAYPNPHPSAKNRRKHKKICGGVADGAAGGSSDEASSDEEKCFGNESEGGDTGRQEVLERNPNMSLGSLGGEKTIERVSARDADLSKSVAPEDNAEEFSSEADSGKSQLDRGVSSTQGVHEVCESEGHEKQDLGDSPLAVVEQANTELTDEQAPDTPDISDIAVSPIDSFISLGELQEPAQDLSEITSNGKASNELKPQEPLNVTTERVDNRTPHLSQPSQQIFLAAESVDKSITNAKKGEHSESTPSQSPVKIGTNSNGSPQQLVDVKNKLLKPGRDSVSNSEIQQSSPESPQGFVRSRVQIFEKLAGTSPEYHRKSVSPSPNSTSPLPPRSYQVSSNGTTGVNSHESPKDWQKTTSHMRRRQSIEREVKSASKPDDAPNELQEILSHLRHRAKVSQ